MRTLPCPLDTFCIPLETPYCIAAGFRQETVETDPVSCTIGPIATVNLRIPKRASTLPAILHVGKLTQNREPEQIPGTRLGRECRSEAEMACA